MTAHPHAQFDQTVLEMIESHPAGAVPGTPAYQDALGRLHASHQIYTSADFKDGHVTARSLTRVPLFHASNLAELFAGSIDPEALEANAAIYDRYIAQLPAAHRPRAEGFRLRVVGRPVHHRAKARADAVHDPVHSLFLVPGTGPHPGLPGNYLYGSLFETGSDAGSSHWALQLHDADDGAATFDAPVLAVALDKLQEVLASAPFTLGELEALGFHLN
jgi:hypothetical protein